MARNDKRFLRPCAHLSKCEENFERAIKSVGDFRKRNFHVITPDFFDLFFALFVRFIHLVKSKASEHKTNIKKFVSTQLFLANFLLDYKSGMC